MGKSLVRPNLAIAQGVGSHAPFRNGGFLAVFKRGLVALCFPLAAKGKQPLRSHARVFGL